MATGFGLIPVRKINGGQVQTRVYSVPSTDATAIFVGDPVELTGAMDATGQFAVVKKLASATNTPLGVLVGVLPDPVDLYTPRYRAASTARLLIIADDLQNTVFQAQEDAVSNVVTAANVGAMYNISLIAGNGSTATGQSGYLLDSSSAVATALNFKIVGVAPIIGNAAAQTTGAILEVIGLVNALNQTDSIT